MANLLLNVAIGFAANSLIYLLQPRKTQKIEGARTTDLNAPKSNYGLQIPTVFGTARVAGNLIWANKIREVVKKKKSGGKGFGQKTETKTYTYFGDFATLLCKGPIVGIRKIWLNSKLVYNVGADADTATYNNSVKFRDSYLRFYNGEHDSSPDSLIQASLALGNTNAFRNRAYIVFANLPLEEYGNRFPVVSAEVVAKGQIVSGRIIPHDENLGAIVTKICGMVGLESSDLEVNDLSDIAVRGYVINSSASARSFLGELSQAYQFEAIESGGKLKFKKIARSRPSMIIRREDLAAYENGNSRPNRYLRTKTEELELPKSVSLQYISIEKDYADSVARAVKSVANNNNNSSLDIPLVLTKDEAKAIAEKLLYLAWQNRTKYEFSLLPKFLALEPGDTVLIYEEYNAIEIKISKLDLGANLLMAVEGTLYSSNVHQLPIPTTPYTPPPIPITSQGDTNLKILDIPLINDSDADIGVYVMGDGGANWRNASVYVSRDNGANWSFASFLLTRSTGGICNTVLDPNATTLSVTINSGELETVALAALDRGDNTAVVGSEIIRFTTATLTANQTYTLSGIQRGKRGTEWAVASHIPDEPFSLVSDYIERIEGSFSDIGQTLQFKALTTGQSLDEVNPVSITFNGRSSKPYSPVNLIATKDAVGNITIAWDRRDRKGGDRTDYANLPLSEAYEKYEVDIFIGGIFRRTISTTSRNAYYAKENQIADTGSVQSQITVDIFQISGVVGRGNAGTGVLTPTFVNAVPKITGFTPTSGQIGDTIRVYGSGLAEVTNMAIGSVNCTSLAVVNDGEITAVVATGTTGGKITVVADGGTAESAIAWVISSITSWQGEDIDDRVAALLQAGSNITLAYNDTANTLTITAAGLSDTQIRDLLAGLTGVSRLSSDSLKEGTTNLFLTSSERNTLANFSENVDDRVAALLQAGSNITLTYDDTANTLTIASASSSTASSLILSGTATGAANTNITVTWSPTAILTTGSDITKGTSTNNIVNFLTAGWYEVCLLIAAPTSGALLFLQLSSAADLSGEFGTTGIAVTQAGTALPSRLSLRFYVSQTTSKNLLLSCSVALSNVPYRLHIHKIG